MALKVQLFYSTAYHAQADGQSERTNQTMEIMLQHWIATHRRELWNRLVSVRHRVEASTEPATTCRPSRQVRHASGCGALSGICSCSNERRFDDKHKDIHFNVGDMVYLKLGDGYNIIANKLLPAKLKQRFVGKFRVLERVSRLAYRLELPPAWIQKKIHPVISVAHLGPTPKGEDPWNRQPADTHEPTFDDRYPEDTDRYDVERILAKETRPSRGRPKADGSRASTTWYLVRWAGQSAKEDQWIPESETEGCHLNWVGGRCHFAL